MSKQYEDGDGEIFSIGDKTKFARFTTTYRDVCDKYKIGFGFDRLGRPSVYLDNDLIDAWSFYKGKFWHYDMTKSEFFVVQAQEEKFDDEENKNEKIKPAQYVSGSRFTLTDFDELMDWAEEDGMAIIYSVEKYFEEKKLSDAMFDKGCIYRSPAAWAGLYVCTSFSFIDRNVCLYTASRELPKGIKGQTKINGII